MADQEKTRKPEKTTLKSGTYRVAEPSTKSKQDVSGICLQRVCQVRFARIKTDVLGGEHLDSLSPREESAVNGVHNGLGGDLLSAKVSAIEALDRILATLDAIKLQVDISL